MPRQSCHVQCSEGKGRLLAENVLKFTSGAGANASNDSMNVLIVYAHPEPHSFSGAMKDLAVSVLENAGHQIQVSDLYALKFDPAGGPADFADREDRGFFHYQREQTHAVESDSFVPQLKAEMDKLRRADLVIFQFPLWWFSLPAILKGWVDRVFAMGFAYGAGQRHETGVFRGKRAMLAFTTGGPPASYVAGGAHGDIDELLRHIQYGMFHFVGMDVLPPFIAYGAGRVTAQQREEYLEAYRARILEIESTRPLEFHKAAGAG
jgi:NAD(P)H dehydrogenase (quinone)